ncbi:MAG: S9 family peptidase [Bacteroides sp.]|nr:S9 family peptidase [Bacteroides sp.]
MKKIILFASAVLLTCGGLSSKKILSHDDFDRWEKLINHSVSNNGEWASFSVNPQEGDGVLTFYNTSNGKRIDIARGYRPAFSADGKWAFALIKPFFAATRQAKIDKKKSYDMPQDSLAIITLSTGNVEKIGNVTSYKTGKEGGDWVAWLSCDTTYIKPDKLKDKECGRPMVVRHLPKRVSKVVNWVGSYVFSKDGSKLAFEIKGSEKDSLITNGMGVIMLPDTSMYLIDRDKKFYGTPVINEAGTQLAFTASNDSVESGTKKAELYLVDLTDPLVAAKSMEIRYAGKGSDGNDLMLNQYSKPQFSHDGKRLIVGIAPYIAPDDTTLVDFEKGSLDIWRWDAPYTPPKENNMVDQLREKTFPVVMDLATGSQVLTTDNPLVEVTPPNRWDSDWALLADPKDAVISMQWDYQFPLELSIKNIVTGEAREVSTAHNDMFELSPAGKYIVWFDRRNYYSYNIATGKTNVISDRVPYPLWDENQDVPLKELEAYGIMAWTENDNDILVYDRHDVWSLDPNGEREPVCVTAGEGRNKGLRIRMVKTDPEFQSLKIGDTVLFSLFDFNDKRNGLATQKFTGRAVAPKIDFLDEYAFGMIRKAKDANVYSWTQENFNTSPNVYVSRNIEKREAKRVSDTNPQMAEYNWGTAQLFRWYAYDGKPSEGVLYLPEDFDADKSYPMISYFYETYTDDLYRHYDMEPSWSWINFPFYVSRGYVVFVPDVHYTAGIPGENAYNYVCSGIEEVCRQYPNIDKKRIGIDGQSWGGYQTAYLVTRTNMFACAGSGAPVANMTSAFGGIRWGSGESRQAQYEVGQSRIGRNLWEAPQLYLANSPVFYADRVETPLLIMHNDNDGAVPWYQGIEMFMALRRLGKPVWMLQYNGEAHNIKERRNRKDITRRLQQFFDHYLKGDPMPEWMKNGIPAVRKGQEYGFGLTEQ